MATYTAKIADELNGILEKNIDAERGFGNAANNTDNRLLAVYFNKKALQRRSFVTELKTEITLLDREHDTSGSAKGTAHRAWTNFKSLFGKSDEAMLEESIRVERASVDEYGKVLQDGNLPRTTSTMLRNQMLKIESGLALIKNLKHLEERKEAY